MERRTVMAVRSSTNRSGPGVACSSRNPALAHLNGRGELPARWSGGLPDRCGTAAPARSASGGLRARLHVDLQHLTEPAGDRLPRETSGPSLRIAAPILRACAWRSAKSHSRTDSPTMTTRGSSTVIRWHAGIGCRTRTTLRRRPSSSSSGSSAASSMRTSITQGPLSHTPESPRRGVDCGLRGRIPGNPTDHLTTGETGPRPRFLVEHRSFERSPRHAPLPSKTRTAFRLG